MKRIGLSTLAALVLSATMARASPIPHTYGDGSFVCYALRCHRLNDWVGGFRTDSGNCRASIPPKLRTELFAFIYYGGIDMGNGQGPYAWSLELKKKTRATTMKTCGYTDKEKP